MKFDRCLSIVVERLLAKGWMIDEENIRPRRIGMFHIPYVDVRDWRCRPVRVMWITVVARHSSTEVVCSRKKVAHAQG